MVEGVPRGHEDGGENGVDVVKDIVGGKAEDVEATSAEAFVARFVALGIVAHVVGGTIHLDDKGGVAAEEVDNVRVDGVLLAKLEIVWAGAEVLPEDDFRKGHRAAERSGSVYRLPA